jgi:hypothetical protein
VACFVLGAQRISSRLEARDRSISAPVIRPTVIERILRHAITERFETTSSGALVAAVENSTKPVTTRVTHAGIAIVVQYDLRLP